MSTHRRYNAGPVVGFLAHGNTSRKKPPLTTILDGFDCLEVIRKYEKGHGYVLYVDDHKKIMELLLCYGAACASNPDPAEILANYLNLVPAAVNHTRHISERFLPVRNDNDILAADSPGHVIVVNDVSYDIRFFGHRVRLMDNQHSLHLTPNHVKKIKDFQTQQMSVINHIVTPQEIITTAWETRERIVSNPCGLLWDKKKLDKAALPPDDEYISLSYKLRLTDVTVSAVKFVNVSVFLNKAAIEYDKSVSSDVNLSTYEGLPKKICKSSVLSGKHFIFTHLECIKPKCDDHTKPCSTAAFNLSNLLNSFISKLHVLIENTTSNITLAVSDKLGTQSPAPPDATFTYYDFAMPRESTLVLVSCTGHDTVIHDIFGT